MSLIRCSLSHVIAQPLYVIAPAAVTARMLRPVTTRGQAYKKGVVTTWRLFPVLAVTHTTRVRATTLSAISDL